MQIAKIPELRSNCANRLVDTCLQKGMPEKVYPYIRIYKYIYYIDSIYSDQGACAQEV